MLSRLEKCQKTITQLQETHEADQKYIVSPSHSSHS